MEFEKWSRYRCCLRHLGTFLFLQGAQARLSQRFGISMLSMRRVEFITYIYFGPEGFCLWDEDSEW
jgi:hypothetical protein